MRVNSGYLEKNNSTFARKTVPPIGNGWKTVGSLKTKLYQGECFATGGEVACVYAFVYLAQSPGGPRSHDGDELLPAQLTVI